MAGASSPGLRGRAGTRILVAAAAGASTTAAITIAGKASAAPAVGWLVAAAIYLTWNWAVILPMNPQETAAHATREDPSQAASDLLILAGSVASLAAVAVLLTHAHPEHHAAQELNAALAVCSVAASWLMVHTVFVVRYARLYYTGPDCSIDFNQDIPPRYTDFAYLAFTIGMTYQVSDTSLRTPQIRATALRQGLLSFFLAAVVLATAVNLVASLATSGG